MIARQTTHRGIAMRSRLEGRFARYLDEMGIEWTYEPRAYSGAAGDYLPDFELTSFAAPVFVEIKPRHDREEEIERAMERMEIIWESLPDAAFMVVFDDTPAILRTEGRRWEVLETGLPGWGQDVPVVA